ncbi:MAG: phosphotransferase family protein [Alphaproteobacteria bacterium]|nr:phosphotransferase family protein [Alphaproteobacteria bacterium]
MPEAIDPALQARIAALPCWRGRIEIAPLAGGMTNRNLLVRDGDARYVARLGNDIPVHGVMRFNELAASRAAHAAGLSPEVVHAAPGLMILRYIEGRALEPQDVRDPARLNALVDLVRRCHRDVPRFLRGPVLAFNVFHVLRDYAATLRDGSSPYVPRLATLMARVARLEEAVGAIDLVFGHNDLLAANLIDDGRRLWLIDWDYAGFGAALFDLAGLSSNNLFSSEHEVALLQAYFGATPDDGLRRRFAAMKCASLLRETMWSMVAELMPTVSGVDFAAYTRDNLARFEAAWAALEMPRPG